MSTTMKDRVNQLTPRQREVVRLVSLGCTMDEAAAILKLSPSTVDNHRARAMKILGADKAAIVTRLAIKHRISPLTDQLTAAEKRKSGRKQEGWN